MTVRMQKFAAKPSDAIVAQESNIPAMNGLLAAGSVLAALLFLSACTPTVKVEAPKEPITINLNVKLDAEVRVKLEEQAREDIQSNPGIF